MEDTLDHGLVAEEVPRPAARRFSLKDRRMNSPLITAAASRALGEKPKLDVAAFQSSI